MGCATHVRKKRVFFLSLTKSINKRLYCGYKKGSSNVGIASLGRSSIRIYKSKIIGFWAPQYLKDIRSSEFTFVLSIFHGNMHGIGLRLPPNCKHFLYLIFSRKGCASEQHSSYFSIEGCANSYNGSII